MDRLSPNRYDKEDGNLFVFPLWRVQCPRVSWDECFGWNMITLAEGERESAGDGAEESGLARQDCTCGPGGEC